MSVRDNAMQVIVDSDSIRVVSAGETGPRGQDSVAAGAIITDPNDLIVGDNTGQPVAVPGSVNVRAYGAVGDGSTDDTAAVAAAFTAADTLSRPVYLPAGTYLTDTIEYAGQSIIGDGSELSALKGKASQDVLHVDPAVGQFAKSGMTLRGFKIIVNDTVDAAASFAQRGGVGNAGFAVDFANGAGTPPLMMINSTWEDLTFEGSSLTTNGQNNAAGIYTQFQTINLAKLNQIKIGYLEYGWWDHFPTSNVASSEHARDHVDIGFIYFTICGNPWRIVNAGDWRVGTVAIHNCTGPGITFHGVTSSIRTNCTQLKFNNLMIEDGDDAAFAFTGNTSQHISIDTSDTQGLATATTWAANYSTLINWRIHVTGDPVNVLSVTGNQNSIELVAGGSVNAGYLRDSITDTGSGNRVTMIAQSSNTAAQRFPQRLSRANWEKHVPDAASLLQGHVDPMYVSGNDLIVHPLQIHPDGGAYTENTDYSYVTDSSADYGVAFRHLVSGHLLCTDNGINGLRGLRVGRWLPPTKLRAYAKAKANSSGSHTFGVWDSGAGDLGSTSVTLTTSYVVYSWEVDLSAQAFDATLYIFSQSTSSNRPVDIAWMAFQPYAKNALINGVMRLAPITLPATCIVGDMCVDTADKKVKVCTATNTWTVVGSQ